MATPSKNKTGTEREAQDVNNINKKKWHEMQPPMASEAPQRSKKKTPNALRRAEAGDTQRTREVPEERPSSVSRWLPMCPLRPC